MRRNLTLATIVLAWTAILLTGCDTRPAPPKNESGKRVKVVTVSASNRAELKAATDMEKARVNYKYRLEVLKSYYRNVGNSDKYNWACNELNNLAEDQTFRWEGLPKITPPKGESLVGADERRLVEQTIEARMAYKNAQDVLIALYTKEGKDFKASLIRNVQDRLDPIRTYMYFLTAEIPPANLKPSAMISPANALYDKAYNLYRSGKIAPLLVAYDKERQALLLFQKLIRDYPTSDKIALAAYFIGDIYKEYFDEDYRAVHWYERAWQWDPDITEPARFQAAVVWDLRLHNRGKALELYREVIKHEQFNQSNVSFATQRIKELTAPQP